MTTPNHGGWTDDKSGLRWEKRRAIDLAAEHLVATEITGVDAALLRHALIGASDCDKLADFYLHCKKVMNTTNAPAATIISGGDEGSDTSWRGQLRDAGFGEDGRL